MKTAIISTCWLDKEDYLFKTAKFIKYYCQPQVMADLGISEKDIWFVDNASSPESHDRLRALIPDLYDKVSFKKYTKYYSRTAHLEYPYCWRALYFARDLFQEYDYDKVVSTNNDSFIISSKFANFIKEYKSGYWVPWCNKFHFPECEIQIITKDNKSYWNMTATPYLEQNGKYMEVTIPAVVGMKFIGDRHSQDGIKEQQPGWDYSTQVPMDMEIKYDTRLDH